MFDDKMRDELFEKTIQDYEEIEFCAKNVRKLFGIYKNLIKLFNTKGISHEQISEINNARDNIERFLENINTSQDNEIKNLHNEIKNVRKQYYTELERKRDYKTALLTALIELNGEKYVRND